MGLIFPRAAFSKSAIKTLASKWEQGSRSLGCSGTMFRRDGPRFPHGTGLVPEQNFIISVFISLFILVPLAALQNPRCFPCDLANFAFGTMVPEHLTSLSYSKQVLFRNIFSIFAKNHEVPGQFNSKGAGVPVRFAPLLSSLLQPQPGRYLLRPGSKPDLGLIPVPCRFEYMTLPSGQPGISQSATSICQIDR